MAQSKMKSHIAIWFDVLQAVQDVAVSVGGFSDVNQLARTSLKDFRELPLHEVVIPNSKHLELHTLVTARLSGDLKDSVELIQLSHRFKGTVRDFVNTAYADLETLLKIEFLILAAKNNPDITWNYLWATNLERAFCAEVAQSIDDHLKDVLGIPGQFLPSFPSWLEQVNTVQDAIRYIVYGERFKSQS
jgi:hypothetical protein